MFSFLKSVKLAIVLIVLLTILIMAGMVIPQANLKPALYAQWRASHPAAALVVERLGLDRTFTSWWFLVVVGMFFVNTLACTVDQAVKTWRQARKDCGAFQRRKTVRRDKMSAEQERFSSPDPPVEHSEKADHPEKMITSLLRSRHYVVQEDATQARTAPDEPERDLPDQETRLVLAEKNRIGYWGSVVFHAGLLLVILGVGYGSLGRFEGVILVTEGERRTEGHQEYIYLEEGPAFAEAHPGFVVGLEKVRHFSPTKKTLGGMASSLTLDGKPFQLDQRAPLVYRGFRIYQDRFGNAVSFESDTGRGTPLLFTAGLLDQITMGGSKVSKGSLIIPGTNLRARLVLYANADSKDGKLVATSLVLKRPILEVTLEDPAGTRVFKGKVEVGQEVRAAGLKLAFTGASYWLALRIKRDPGLGLIYAGFGVVLLGLILLYFLIPRQVWVKLTADPGQAGGWKVDVGGRTLRHSELLEGELEEIRRELADRGTGAFHFHVRGGRGA